MSFATSAVPSSVQESLKLQFLIEKDISVQGNLKKKGGCGCLKLLKGRKKEKVAINLVGISNLHSKLLHSILQNGIAQAKCCIFTKILHIVLYLTQMNHMRFLLVFKMVKPISTFQR